MKNNIQTLVTYFFQKYLNLSDVLLIKEPALTAAESFFLQLGNFALICLFFKIMSSDFQEFFV